jgi:two-component system, sensor histidine kinase and response regulator
VRSVAAPAAPQNNLGLTEAERAWLAQHSTLTVFTKTDWAPIDLYTLEGQYQGLSAEYLKLIGARLGVQLNYVPQASLAEALVALREGRAQILPSVARTRERDSFMAFSSSYLEVPNVYITRRGYGTVGETLPLVGMRIAVERGFAVRDVLLERHPGAVLVDVADSPTALKAVSEGAADVYVGSLPTSSFLAERMLLTNLEVRTPSRASLSSLHFGVAKENRLLLSILDKALASITLAERQAMHGRWVPLRSALSEPSPPLKLSDDERALVRTLPPLRVGFDVDHYPYTFAKGGAAGVGMVLTCGASSQKNSASRPAPAPAAIGRRCSHAFAQEKWTC